MKRNLPSISVILYRSKVLANGDHPIMLRVSYNGVRKYKSIGLHCAEKHWNERKHEVRASHPLAANMNKIIRIELDKANQYVIGIEGKDYSANTIIKALSKSAPTTHTLFSLFEERMDYFYNTTKKYNTATGYKTLLNIIKRYRENEDMELFEVDAAWLSGFEAHLRLKYKDNSIRKFFDCFRAIFNYALSKEYIKDSPFAVFQFSKKLDCTTRKRALTDQELLTLLHYYAETYGIFGEKEYKVPEKTKVHYWNERFKPKGTNKLTKIDAEQFSLALFFLSFFFQGLALIDIANLRKRDVQAYPVLDTKSFEDDLLRHGIDYANAHAQYVDVYEINTKRAKTGASIRIMVEQQNVWPYLNPFDAIISDDEDADDLDDYLVPIFDKDNDIESVKFGRMTYVNYLVNKNLKIIAARLGLSRGITFYSARHTYASNLYHANVPIGLIAQNMARNPADIQTYLKNFDGQSILDANRQSVLYVRGDFYERWREIRKEQRVRESEINGKD